MITQRDLQEAIAECQGQKNPNASTCIKLAAFLTIQRELFGEPSEVPPRSFAYSPGIEYNGDSEFAKAIQGKSFDEIMQLFDELMSTLATVYPRLYDSVMMRL